MRQAHGRLAPQHGRLEHLAQALLRPAAAVLPVRVRAPERGRLAGRARGAGDRRARPARGAAPAVDRRGADPLRGVRRGGASGSPRSATSGSTPASSRSRRSAGRTRSGSSEGYATGAAEGLTRRRPARPRVLGAVVPGRLGLGDARADPALVLLAALHVGRRSTGRAPYRQVLGYEKLLDETGREMHSSWGNTIDADEAFDAHGRRRDALAVLRAAARPEPPASATARRTRSSAAAHALELASRSSSTYANIEGFAPRYGDLDARARRELSRSTAGSSRGRTQLVARGDRGLRALLTRRRHPRVRGVRRRSLELVHPPLAAALLGRRRGGAPDALVRARPGAARDRAGDAVPRRAPLAGASSRRRARARRSRCFLAGWPEARRRSTTQLLAEVAEVRRVVELGHQARAARRAQAAPAAARGSSSRARTLAAAHADEIARGAAGQGGRVRRGRGAELRVKPNLPVLGPKLGQGARRGPRGARRRASSRSSTTARFRVAGHELEPDEVLVERAGQGGLGGRRRRTASRSRSTRRSTTSSTLEGRVYDLIHRVNAMRKEAGPRADRPDRAHAARPPTPTCSSTPTGSSARRSRDRARVGETTSDDRPRSATA